MKEIEDLLINIEYNNSSKLEMESIDWKIKVYKVNSSPKYAYSSIRIDLQDKELRDYS